MTLWSFCVVGYWSFLFLEKCLFMPILQLGCFLLLNCSFQRGLWGKNLRLHFPEGQLFLWLSSGRWMNFKDHLCRWSIQPTGRKLRGAPVGQKQRFFFFFSRNNSQAGHIGTCEECLIMQSMHSGRECEHAQEWAAEIFLNLRVCYLSRWCLGSQSS